MTAPVDRHDGTPEAMYPPDVAELHRHGLAQTLFGHPAQRTHLTKSERAYAAVRRAIVTHALPPSVPLDEYSLLAQFPYGRTPLREALKRLSHEHLLVWPPHQAPMVRDIGLYDLAHLYETRELLETRIAHLAAERAGPKDLATLNGIRERLSHATDEGSIYEAVELDYALHAAIARTTRNRYLTEASNLLNLQSLRLWYRAHNELGVSIVNKAHIDLVASIENHDPEAAVALAIEHVVSSRSRQDTLLLGSTSPVLPDSAIP
jgi:DNA-binding GntR family transcriptional regulator